jgi:hypothetical protein
MVGSQVTIEGWYKRTPRPMVMIKRLYTLDGRDTMSSNRDIFSWIFVVLLFVAALVCIFYGLPIF